MRLADWLACTLIAFAGTDVYAQSWSFNETLDITASAKAGVFHHLESSGRRNIAVSGNTVAVTWEDDRDGVPRIYLALKDKAAIKFGQHIQVSASGEAFEPGLVALSDGLFAVVWEEDERVYVRIASSGKMGAAFRLSDVASGQASMTVIGDQLLVAFREQQQRYGSIMLRQLSIANKLELSVTSQCRVDVTPVKDDQLYPVVAVVDDRAVVAWEDRRLGHTVIMASQAKPGKACDFASPARVSEQPEGPRAPYGAGHGVARVALAGYGQSNLYAIWADKRDFREGYDIYGAGKQGSNGFGANVRVQDDFGGNYRQWHSTMSGLANGILVAAWTDERDGSMDIWYSWLEDGEWSDDQVLPGASGPGIQYHPSITLDAAGGLHAAWVERDEVGGPTRLRYLQGMLE